MAKIKVLDYAGQCQELDLGMDTLKEAEASGAPHVLRHLDDKVFTGDNPSVSQQVYAVMGVGRKRATVRDVQEARAIDQSRFEAASTNDGSVVGRIVTMAYLMDAIENQLSSKDYGINAVFNKKAAIVDAIPDSRFDRPIINYTGPNNTRSNPVAQLAEPTSNVLLTASDRSFKIASHSIGIEYSDQVSTNLTLPIVALSMQRQAEMEYNQRVQDKLLSFLQGDTDLSMTPLTGVTAGSLDSSITVPGVLTQKAWMKWLFQNSNQRKIDTIVCNMDTALAIEARTGRPTVMTDNPNSTRIDAVSNVMNPTWSSQIDVIIAPNFPANTVMGFDSRYGYHLVTSTSLAYSSVEAFATRRSTKIRIDYGDIAYRLYDNAFSVLTVTP